MSCPSATTRLLVGRPTITKYFDQRQLGFTAQFVFAQSPENGDSAKNEKEDEKGALMKVIENYLLAAKTRKNFAAQ